MYRKASKIITSLALLLFGVLIFAGCGDDVNTTGGSSGDTSERITSLATNPSQIQIGTEAEVTGLVVDSAGDPVAGRQVIFAVDPTESGYFLPAMVTTGSDGTFAAVFVPLDTGDVQIIAVTPFDVTSTYSTQIQDSEGYQSGEWRFDFTSTPSFGLADGDDVAVIEIEIYDSDNEPIDDGLEVRLEAGEKFEDIDGDGYFTENVDEVLIDINENLIWDRVGTLPRTVTSSGGKVSFNYTSGTVAGLIYIRATVVDELNDQVYSGEHPMVLRPSEDIASIDLSTDRQEIQVKATGGIEFANILAMCYDAYGNRVQSEVPVEMFIVYGPGGGERFTVSVYDSSSSSPDTIIAMTNVIGEATAAFFSGIKSGTVMLQARAGDIYSNFTLVNINAGPPYEISVGSAPCNIRGWDFVNITSEIVAVVNDTYGNPVADTTEVFFWTDEGLVEAASYTEGGVCGVTYHSGDPRGDGIAIVRAETAGGTVADSTIVIVSGPAVTVEAYGYATSLHANGEDYTDIWVDARDINNNFMVDGTEVEILMSDGSILNGNLSDGCYGSLARIRYKTSTLSRDYEYSVPDNGLGRILTGAVQVGGVNGPSTGVSIQLLTSVANTSMSEAKIDATIAPGSTVPLDVLILDRAGNPLGGHLLVPSANLGTISPANVYTNDYGEASFSYTAPPGIGTDYVTVSDQDPGYGGIIITKKVKIDVTD